MNISLNGDLQILMGKSSFGCDIGENLHLCQLFFVLSLEISGQNFCSITLFQYNSKCFSETFKFQAI